MARTELNAAAVRLALEQRREQELIAEQAAQCTASFRVFVESAWPVIEPRTLFVSGWHIDAICEYLQAASRGEIRRLLINIPPRHMKSIAVSVMWPAWLWTFAPHLRFLTASYGASLAERDAVRTQGPAPLPLVPGALARARAEGRRQPHQPLREHAHRLPARDLRRRRGDRRGRRCAHRRRPAQNRGSDERQRPRARARLARRHPCHPLQRPQARNRGRRHAAHSRARPLRPPTRAAATRTSACQPATNAPTPSSGRTTPEKKKGNCSGRRTSPSRQ